ncbi:helix-turn-helix domain-containing protein [Jeotgalibacillus proteolyticus]|uniref:helix-turn-helix domain-containing protein n=1 Tax=Jeotgalibacillus proteolyticus TaxID=2082395 RepID=UPI003CF9444B
MDRSDFTQAHIQELFSFIHDHIDDKLTLEELAKISSYSPFHFHRKFKKFIGETPNDYIVRIRLEFAAHLLWYQPEVSITDIAYRCGFSSPSHLSRSFLKYFHMSPSKIREKGYPSQMDKAQNSKIMQVIDDNSLYTTTEDPFSLLLKEHIQLESFQEFHLKVMLEVNGYEADALKKSWKQLALETKATQFVGLPLDNPFITPKEKCRYLCGAIAADRSNEKLHVVPATDALTVNIPNQMMTRDEIDLLYSDLYNTFPSTFNAELSWEYPFEFVYMTTQEGEFEFFVHKICVPVKKRKE